MEDLFRTYIDTLLQRSRSGEPDHFRPCTFCRQQMKEYLPYLRVRCRIAVLRDPSAYQPDNSSLDDKVAVQG